MYLGLRDLHVLEHGVDAAEPTLETGTNEMEWDDEDGHPGPEENLIDTDSEIELEEGDGDAGDGEGGGENIVDDAFAEDLAAALIMDDDSEPDLAPDAASAEDTQPAQEPLAKRLRAETPSASSSSAAAHLVDPVSRKKIHSSPREILGPLSPPGCVLTLSYNDHRFKATWKKTIKCEFWIDELANMSFSSSFDQKEKDSWQKSLRLVHANAWDKWDIAKGTSSELKLPQGMKPQKPGEISSAIFDELTPIIARLPPPKQYVR